MPNDHTAIVPRGCTVPVLPRRWRTPTCRPRACRKRTSPSTPRWPRARVGTTPRGGNRPAAHVRQRFFPWLAGVIPLYGSVRPRHIINLLVLLDHALVAKPRTVLRLSHGASRLSSGHHYMGTCLRTTSASSVLPTEVRSEDVGRARARAAEVVRPVGNGPDFNGTVVGEVRWNDAASWSSMIAPFLLKVIEAFWHLLTESRSWASRSRVRKH